jgi:hypothetical protein
MWRTNSRMWRFEKSQDRLVTNHKIEPLVSATRPSWNRNENKAWDGLASKWGAELGIQTKLQTSCCLLSRFRKPVPAKVPYLLFELLESLFLSVGGTSLLLCHSKVSSWQPSLERHPSRESNNLWQERTNIPVGQCCPRGVGLPNTVS